MQYHSLVVSNSSHTEATECVFRDNILLCADYIANKNPSPAVSSSQTLVFRMEILLGADYVANKLHGPVISTPQNKLCRAPTINSLVIPKSHYVPPGEFFCKVN